VKEEAQGRGQGKAPSPESGYGDGEQLALEACKVSGCGAEVVGSSITGKGHVCGRHNTEEWGRALARNREPYYRTLGRELLQDAAA
jgi:hypothetical protein